MGVLLRIDTRDMTPKAINSARRDDANKMTIDDIPVSIQNRLARFKDDLWVKRECMEKVVAGGTAMQEEDVYQGVHYRLRGNNYELLRSVHVGTVGTRHFGTVKNVFLAKTTTLELAILLNTATHVDKTLCHADCLHSWTQWLIEGGDRHAHEWINSVSDSLMSTELKRHVGGRKRKLNDDLFYA